MCSFVAKILLLSLQTKLYYPKKKIRRQFLKIISGIFLNYFGDVEVFLIELKNKKGFSTNKLKKF